ncbi:hypothetical protein [Bartonella sp. CM100XJJH]|uniref:hypothetical protein n=1 Tax=Bartonella sp. CM100XJJH TaxID=3243543 RepID=UPI0035D0BA83
MISGVRLTPALEEQAFGVYQTVQNLLTLKAPVEDMAKALEVLGENNITVAIQKHLKTAK